MDNKRAVSTTVRPLRYKDVEKFRNWGVHDDQKLSSYVLPDLWSSKTLSWYRKAKWFIKRRFPGLCWIFAVIGDDGNMVGYYRVMKKSPFDTRAELGVMFNPALIGRGMGRETFPEILRICFQDLNLTEVWAEVAEFNVRSMRVLTGAGFTQYNSRMMPHDMQTMKDELLKDSPEFFVLDGNVLMTRMLYMKLNRTEWK